jgi:hypothetical protein
MTTLAMAQDPQPMQDILRAQRQDVTEQQRAAGRQDQQRRMDKMHRALQLDTPERRLERQGK